MFLNVENLTKNKVFIKYLNNSLWMLAEYGLRVVSSIVVIVYMARYLGPDKFGLLSYALSIVAIFMAISRLGMESVLVRDLAKYASKATVYLATSFKLMLIASIVTLITLYFLVYFLEDDIQVKIYIWIIATGLLFQTFLVVDYNFQSRVEAKYSSIAKSCALLVSSIVKVYLVLVESDLIAFAFAFAFDHLIVATMLIIMHFHRKQNGFLVGFDKIVATSMLKSAWPMVLASIAGLLYMRIDQVMIKHMLNAHELGLYAAATKIYEGWMIVPYVLSISLLPAIVKLKRSSSQIYEEKMSQLFALVFWTGVVVAIFTTFLSEWVINNTFGEVFSASSGVLAISMWAAALTAIGSVTARYLTVENMEKKITLRTFIALLLNILLNLFLIPLYGIEGASIATLITVLFANYLINYMDHELKPLVKICNNAIFFKFWR